LKNVKVVQAEEAIAIAVVEVESPLHPEL